MSVQATTWVWDHSQATGSAFVVLLAVADAANASGERSCQSVETLAHMARVSVRTVQRSLRELEESGELENEGRDRRYAANAYRLPLVAALRGANLSPLARGANLSPLADTGVVEGCQSVTPERHSYVTPGGASGVTPVAPGVTNEAARGDIAVSPNPNNPKLSNESYPKLSAGAAEEIDPFDDFWTSYPRRVGKGQAAKAWKAATKKAAPDVILAGLRSHLPALQSKERQFIPHPATWLNGERWADEPDTVEPRAGDTRAIPTDHWDAGGGFFDGWRSA